MKYCCLMRFNQTSSVFNSKQGDIICCYCFSLNTWKTNLTLRWSNFLFAFQINYYLNLRNWSVLSSQVVSALVSADTMHRQKCEDVCCCLPHFVFFCLFFFSHYYSEWRNWWWQKCLFVSTDYRRWQCWNISMSSEKFSQSGLLCQSKQNSV